MSSVICPVEFGKDSTGDDTSVSFNSFIQACIFLDWLEFCRKILSKFISFLLSGATCRAKFGTNRRCGLRRSKKD